MHSDFSLNKGLSVPVSIINPKSYVISTTNNIPGRTHPAVKNRTRSETRTEQ